MTTLRAIVALLGGWRAAAFAALLVLASGFGWIQTQRLDHAKSAQAIAQRDAAQAAAYASEQARIADNARAEAVNFASETYEKGKRDAQAAADRTAADLRTGNVRLRAEIRALAARGVPGDPAAAGQPEGAAERGEALVGAAVGVGHECDAAQQALIQAYEAARGQHASRPGN